MSKSKSVSTNHSIPYPIERLRWVCCHTCWYFPTTDVLNRLIRRLDCWRQVLDLCTRYLFCLQCHCNYMAHLGQVWIMQELGQPPCFPNTIVERLLSFVEATHSCSRLGICPIMNVHCTNLQIIQANNLSIIFSHIYTVVLILLLAQLTTTVFYNTVHTCTTIYGTTISEGGHQSLLLVGGRALAAPLTSSAMQYS